jgi:hypothetical protein
MIRRDINVTNWQEIEANYARMINKVEDEFGSEAWREIRAGDYWEKKDALPNTMEKQKFTIERIAIWIRENK